MSGTRAASFSLLGSKKWIIREGRNGISRSGAGAPTASGAKKSFGLRIDRDPTTGGSGRSNRSEAGTALVEFAIVFPILVMLVLGILTGGIALNRDIGVTNGVREGSRFAATFAVSECTPATLDCWLRKVATVTRQGSEGELNASVSSSVVCVAYISPNTTTNDKTMRFYLRGATTQGPEDGACYDDGRGPTTGSTAERRVQVTGERTSKIEFLLGSVTPTLASRSVARFEKA